MSQISQECYECHKSEDETTLQKCPICFKRFCEEHGYHRSGLRFCSSGCAEYFFFSEPDD
jgi:hypothetical protein